MGTFTVPIQIGDLAGTQFIEVEALVDTGTTYTTLPVNIVAQIGIEQHGVRRFELADNRIVEYPVGEARIRLLEDELVVLIVFASPDTVPLLGATALQLFSLGVDPVNHRLIPVPALMKCATVIGGAMTTGEAYAHPEFLVEAGWVDAHQNDPDLVVVDTDVEAAYLRGHIPGAVMVPDNYEKDPESGRVHILPPDKFASLCQGLGIGDNTLVVAYDHSQSLYAARLWWALNYYGHSNVKVLNGGWRSWVNEGGSISFDTGRLAGGAGQQGRSWVNEGGFDRPTAPASVKFTTEVNDSIMVKVDELKEACSLSDAVIWDVRSDGEYDGSNSRGNRRAGHIPGAVHLEWFNVMDRDTHRFQPADQVRRMLTEKGITPDKAVYTY